MKLTWTMTATAWITTTDAAQVLDRKNQTGSIPHKQSSFPSEVSKSQIYFLKVYSHWVTFVFFNTKNKVRPTDPIFLSENIISRKKKNEKPKIPSLRVVSVLFTVQHTYKYPRPHQFSASYFDAPFPLFFQRNVMYSVFSLYCVTRDVYFHPQPRQYCFCAYTIIKWTPTQDFSKYHIFFLNTFLPRLEKIHPKGKVHRFFETWCYLYETFLKLRPHSNSPIPPELLEVL